LYNLNSIQLLTSNVCIYDINIILYIIQLYFRNTDINYLFWFSKFIILSYFFFIIREERLTLLYRDCPKH